MKLSLIVYFVAYLFSFHQKKELEMRVKEEPLTSIGKTVIEIYNPSDKKLFYFITLSVKKDTGWTTVSNDVKTLGRNEIVFMREILPKNRQTQILNIEKIPRRFFDDGKNLFRLKMQYSTKKSLLNNLFRYDSVLLNVKK